MFSMFVIANQNMGLKILWLFNQSSKLIKAASLHYRHVLCKRFKFSFWKLLKISFHFRLVFVFVREDCNQFWQLIYGALYMKRHIKQYFYLQTWQSEANSGQIFMDENLIRHENGKASLRNNIGEKNKKDS